MSRDTRQLHPDLQAIIPEFLRRCRAAGREVRITDCYRNAAEQQDCINRGTTRCYFPNSPHNWMLAFDFCRNDGKGAYNNSDGFFDEVGRIGQSMGLQWGGAWTDFVDKPHLQLAKFFDSQIQTVARSIAKRQYGTPENFKKSFGASKVKDNWANLTTTQLTAKLNGYTGPDITVNETPQAGKVNADGQRGTSPKLLYTGIYDARVKELQQKMGNVAVDGISGPETYNALVTGGYSVNPGDEDWFVEWVQKRLKDLGYNPGVIDGIAGNRTMAAIHAFQTDYGTGASNLNGIDLYYIIES